MKAYKLFFRAEDKKLYSLNKGINDSGLWQRYYVTKTNTPKFAYPILCFDTLDNLLYFAEDETLYDYHVEVWEVEGELDTTPVKVLKPNYMVNFNPKTAMKMFLEEYLTNSYVKHSPEGTVGVKSLKFIKKLDFKKLMEDKFPYV